MEEGGSEEEGQGPKAEGKAKEGTPPVARGRCNKGVIVYVVTADVEMQKRYEEVGFTGILLKPVTVGTIGPVLADTAERRS